MTEKLVQAYSKEQRNMMFALCMQIWMKHEDFDVIFRKKRDSLIFEESQINLEIEESGHVSDAQN